MFATINRILHHPDLGLFILRVSFSLMMLFHGYDKLAHGVGYEIKLLHGIGLPGFIAYGSFLGEIVAPILLILGLFNRIAAVFMAGTMLVAWLLAKVDLTFSLGHYGEWALEGIAVYLFFAICILFTGGGNISVTKNPDLR